MSYKRHALKILGLAVMATLAISAFTAASAPAATWKVNGASLANGESREVTAQLKTGTAGTIKGTLLGQSFHFSIGAWFSRAWSAGKAILSQIGTAAKGALRWVISALKVLKPEGCILTEPIETKPLTSEVVAHGASETTYVKFLPEEGETLATIVVKGCAVAGSYPLKGVIYAEGNKFGEELASQKLNFSPAINTTLGGSFTLGTSAAELTAEGEHHLDSGLKFGVVK